ncbi:MAG: hypothetical protein KAU90_03565, partial [Sulfurovaceae bacterium]|nr:hypothetical protein [Sulfurovaceae bacterium]
MVARKFTRHFSQRTPPSKVSPSRKTKPSRSVTLVHKGGELIKTIEHAPGEAPRTITIGGRTIVVTPKGATSAERSKLILQAVREKKLGAERAQRLKESAIAVAEAQMSQEDLAKARKLGVTTITSSKEDIKGKL